MRFLPSSPARAAAEILLTVAIVAFVVYDLGGRSAAKPEASNVALSFEAKRPAVSSSHFETAVAAGVPTTVVCGNQVAPTNPWVIGNNGTAALVIRLGDGCSPNPAIYSAATNSSCTQALIINSGSWLSFQNIQYDNGLLAGATSGPLSMGSGSFLETIVSPNLVPIPTATTLYPLLLACGPCPSFTGVNILPTTNCPVDTSLALLGSYSCSVVATNVVINGAPYCSLNLAIVGPLTKDSSASCVITMQFRKDCSTFTADQLKLAILGATSIPALAINVKSWSCGPLTVSFVVLGSDLVLINQAVQTILTSAAPGGALNTLLGVTSAGCGLPTNYYPLPYCFYNGQSYCGTTTIHPISSSNPALFALLTLLVIPVALILGIFVWCCMQREVCCTPMPVCMPEPCCFPEPTCAMPCDPCAGATYMNASQAMPMMTSPYQ